MTEPCVFCSILAGEAPWHPVYEDDLTVAFLNLHPAASGHTLLLPREHAPYLWDLSDSAAAALGRSLRHVARVLELELQPDGMTVFQSNRVAGWQSVFHVHFHLVPRSHDDRLSPAWTEMLGDPRELEPLSARLRHAFDSAASAEGQAPIHPLHS